MGIQGLLPTLKSIITPVHIQSYAGKKAAVDTYSWLHKAAYTCSKDLCEGRPTDKFIDYCMHRVNLLRHFGVQPVLVFDGGVLPMKADQEAKRERSRKEHLERAQEHERLGNHAAAYECYQRAVDITPALASRLIKVLQREGVQYVVAPYEADAQMAYLAFHGLVDVIITEDSDLIAYGCPRVLFKMNKSGQGEEFQFSDLVRNKDLNFANFTKQMVLEMCIMTGCDYLPSLPGMGVKKAHALMRRFKSYQKVIRHLRFSGITISAQYEELFERAILTFRHQRVYDPVREEMVHLTDVPSDVILDLEFVGPDLSQHLVKAIAEGEVDPSTRLPFQVDTAIKVAPAVPNIGHKILAHQTVARKPLELLAQKNVLTNYFLSVSQEAKKQFKAPRSALRTEQQTKKLPAKVSSLPAKDSLELLVPDTETVISQSELYRPAREVFGSPLPDDDEDSESDANEEVHKNVPGLEPQDKISRKTGVLQDTLDSSVFQQVSEPAPVKGVFSGKERKKNIADAHPVIQSGYFLHSHLVHSKSDKPRTTDSPISIAETQIQDAGNCNREVAKKSKVDSCRAFFENGEACLSNHTLQPQGNQLSSLAKVAGEGGSSQLGKFSTNVSHVDRFAHIAQKSVERFAQTIAPFRCSKGVRASGLRAPVSSTSTNTFARIGGKAQSTLEANLNQFSYQPSSFKPPSLSLNYSRPRLVTAGGVRRPET